VAISLKTAGTWAEYTTDLQTVAIPGSPAAGDRMFLWVHHKDFAITLATPAGWNLIASFSDGAVAAGNGLGSIQTNVYYRDWQSGDAAPQLDFSTTTNLLAEAVIQLWQKGAGDIWDNPRFVTAAWPVTSATQTISASATVVVPNSSAVMAAIGIRDDSALFTRAATTGIDVSSGITWAADYVESPATHYTTTTGNDHSGDMGHRLVTSGGTVTLRVTATISAVETGSIVWVVQGLAQAVGALSLLDPTSAIYAPTVTGLTPSSTIGALPLLDPTSAIYAPTVVPGPVAVGALPLLDPSSAIYAPTVTPKNTVGELSLLDPASAIYAPTVLPQPVTLGALPLLDPSSTIYAPMVVAGAVTVGALPILDPGSAVYAPTIAPISTVGALDLLDPGAAVYAPTVAPISNVGALPLLDPGTAIYAPTVAPGAAAIGALDLLDPGSAIYEPNVSIEGGPITVGALPLLDPSSAIYAPTVVNVLQLVGDLPLLDPASAVYAPTVGIAGQRRGFTQVLILVGPHA
jgi:hypothetical protein